jgi:uncharacterized membrane protein
LKEDWVDAAIAALLRTGVLLSIGIVMIGMVVTFVHHPDYLSSRSTLGALTGPAAQFPNNMSAIVAGVRSGKGQAIVMAGLLLLIATPVARVALSIVVFVIERDRSS